MGLAQIIADAAVAVRADLKQYDADLKKAEQSGRSSSMRLAESIKKDFGRGLSATAGLVFGIATKGLIELDGIQQQFAADTGATAEEARQAGQAILDMSKRNLQPLKEIGAALGKVHTDLGLTGKEAEDTTELILKFATATGQNAADAVTDLDDILDAWNLTAADAQHVLDNLVASHQKYGGSIADNQKMLATLAPQLKALNLDVDDGQALLNLFAASGLDASKAQFALNSAIQKMPDGETFDQLIARLSGIEDPAERAKAAIEVFGARGGAALANVLRPGVDSLGDFALAATDIEGASTRAGEAIEGSFGNQVRLRIKEFGAAIIEAGQSFGPLLTGLASVGTLLGALGFDKFFKRAFERVAGSAIVNSAVRKAGIAMRVTFALAMFAIDELSNALAGAFSKIPGATKVQSAIGSAGTAMGTKFGGALGVAAGVGIGLALVDLAKGELDEKAAALGEALGKQIAEGTTDELLSSQGRLRSLIEMFTGPGVALNPVTSYIGKDALVQLRTQLDAVDAELARRQNALTTRAGNAAKAAAAETGRALPLFLASGMEQNRARAEQEAAFLGQSVGSKLVSLGSAAIRAGANFALGVASGLRQNRSDIDGAIAQLKDDMEHKLSPKKEVAHDIGLLFGKTLSKGLKSADGVVKAQAEGTRGLIEAQLIETIKAGGKAGKDILDELEKKMHSKDPDVRAQAKRTKGLIDAALKETPGKNPGSQIGDQLASDLGAKSTKLGKVAYDLGRNIAINVMRGVQGVGRLSITNSNGTSGLYSGKAVPLAEGLDYVPYDDMLASLHRGEMVVPAKEADRIREELAGGGEPRGGDSYTWVLPEASDRDPFAILDRTSRWVRWGRMKPEPG